MYRIEYQVNVSRHEHHLPTHSADGSEVYAQIHEAIELVEALRARIQNLEQELPNRVPAAEIHQVQQHTELHDRLQAVERVMQPRPTPRTSTHMEQLLDTLFLHNPRTFTGAHADWNSWSFDVGAFAHALHRRPEDLNQEALTAGAFLTVSDELNVTLRRQLYFVFVSLTSDTAKAGVAKAPHGEGLTAR